MHSINCLSDHGRQAAVENRWSTNCQQTVFPIFLHFLPFSAPRWELALRCAALLKFVQAAKVFECIQAFTHTLTHTHTHLQTHTHAHSCTHGICSCCLGQQLCELHCSCRKCSILFSAYRQTTFSPVSLPNIPHSPPLPGGKSLENVFV